MQNRNEFIQVSKVLLNNLIHSSSFGRNCGLWLMYWARQKVHSWSHLHLIYNCQKTAHQPFPGEEQAKLDFYFGKCNNRNDQWIFKARKVSNRNVSSWEHQQSFGAPRVSNNSSHFQMCCAGKRFFRCDTGRKGKQEKKKKNQPKPTGIKTQVPADTVKQINQLMK